MFAFEIGKTALPHQIDHGGRHEHGNQQQAQQHYQRRGHHKHQQGREHRAQRTHARLFQPAEKRLDSIESFQPGSDRSHRTFPEKVAQSERQHNHEDEGQEGQRDHPRVHAIGHGAPERIEQQ